MCSRAPDANRHNLNLSVSANLESPDGFDNCNEGVNGDGEYTTGGEGPILATTSIPPTNGNQVPAVYVTDADGAIYYMPSKATATGGAFLVSSVIDRNGNSFSITPSGSSGVVYTDTIGRTALSVSSFGGNPDTITPAGISTPYKVYWTSVAAHFTDNMVNLSPGTLPNCPTSMSASSTVMSSIVLPNGRSFTFSYDPTYGMLTKITYPSGGYVRYVWGLNSQAEAGIFPFNVNGSMQVWECRYDYPAITDRYVSYDGTTEVEHQHFTYSTSWTGSSISWNSKSTTVAATDNVRADTFNTTYTYDGSFTTPYVPNCVACFTTDQMPVEKTIQSYDFNGALLQTVAKSWKNVRLVQSVQTTPTGGSPSLKVYCYDNTWEVSTETDEYDFGTGAPTGTCASPPSGTTSGALLKRTVTAYNFAQFASHIVDRPDSVITYDGNLTKVAEEDYYYGSTPTLGNLLTKKDKCFAVPGGTSCSQGDSTTTYSYDSKGQTTSVTDPNGNPATQFYYTDSYSSCGGSAPPQSPSDAYVTQVVYPNVNGVTHSVSFCYDYAAGLLLSSTDENGHAASYLYNDSLRRLTSVTHPDGGTVSYAYNDSGPSPTITTTTKMNASQNLVTVSVLNGLGVPYESQLTSDPYGTDFTLTVMDGSGLPYKVTNPYRSTSDPTYGVTTYTYDALGRTTAVQNPDSSTLTVQYSGYCSTSTDAAGTTRKACVDGLGRLQKVFEDPASLNFETDYAYDGNSNLIRVDQLGAPGDTDRVRIFWYDSMSHLTNACNPESIQMGYSCSTSGRWSDTYSYDRNSNLVSKTDARTSPSTTSTIH